MKVTVFVPIQMNIEGIDRESEVRRVLETIDDIVNQSELESNPCINIELVGDSEIINDDEADGFTEEETKLLKESGLLLSFNDDDELEFMVRAIINHENENELIDYIDGVCVWEKVEYCFTAKQFCQHIGYTGNEFK